MAVPAADLEVKPVRGHDPQSRAIYGPARGHDVAGARRECSQDRGKRGDRYWAAGNP